MGLSLKPGLLLLQFQLQARTQLQVKKATLLGSSSNSACHCQMLITAFIVCLGMMVSEWARCSLGARSGLGYLACLDRT